MKDRLAACLRRLRKNEQALFTILSGLIGLALIISFFTKPGATNPEKPETPDTYIPHGLVLVPIDLANGDALGSMVADFAIVDLFETGRNGAQLKRRVGHRLRLIRAPLNPEKMAVLVPEGQESALLQNENPLFAVVQNRGEKQAGRIPTQAPVRSRIQYSQGGKR